MPAPYTYDWLKSKVPAHYTYGCLNGKVQLAALCHPEASVTSDKSTAAVGSHAYEAAVQASLRSWMAAATLSLSAPHLVSMTSIDMRLFSSS